MSSYCKPKSIIRSFSSFSNSRLNTQEASQFQNQRDWVQIWQGINSIANKIKQISSLHSTGNPNPKNIKSRISETRNAKHLRIKTSMDCSSSLSKKYYSKCLKSQKENNEQSKRRDKGVKDNRRLIEQDRSKSIKCFNRDNSKPKIVEKTQIIWNKNPPVCQTQCHRVMQEMHKLKQINDQLVKKNNLLEKKLKATLKGQQQNNRKRQKINLATRKSIKQKQEQRNKIESYGIQNIQPAKTLFFAKSDKGRGQSQSRQDKHEISMDDIQAKQTMVSNPLGLSQKQNIAEGRRKVLNLSKGKKKVMEENQRNKEIARQLQQKMSKPSQLVSLEQQFDKLVQLSYKQKNKSKKHSLWGEMKEMANKLKIMRQFIQIQ